MQSMLRGGRKMRWRWRGSGEVTVTLISRCGGGRAGSHHVACLHHVGASLSGSVDHLGSRLFGYVMEPE